ncbi:mechanosensitive ion channel [Desulforhopalus vacuolatus]|uniref:mechanosensitive ion channel family protein n=1 Tax=Desulforhopalus vacuolatus TaxID=40414 RepID=UPI001965892E|nr:mechanosensitive ion channel family protein [Desulforhopalus vacuolatus]MBM9519249.1 mechanosensitive ion channel [Desulforhopalus vacuolatus]
MECKLLLSRFVKITYIVLVSIILCGVPVGSLSAAQISKNHDVEVVSSGASTEKQVSQPDASSPRATIESFLSDVDLVVADWQNNIYSEESSWALYRAMQLLDFTGTPDNDSMITETSRILLLKDILDRLNLSARDQIPGEKEVALENISTWTIPGTKITLSRVKDGPQAGQFLFARQSVQNLGRLYRQMKNVPYPSGASSGLYEQFRSKTRSGDYFASMIKMRDLLRGVDTSSPRATFESFLSNINQSYLLVQQAEEKLQENPPTLTTDEAHQLEVRAHNYMRRAVSTLDLDYVPEALRSSVSIEAALQLKEVFDRMVLPALDTIPDLEMVEAARGFDSSEFVGGAKALRWRYPDTEIEIVEITEGKRQGEFLFSADTVKNIEDIYYKVENIPYRVSTSGPRVSEYQFPGTSENFFINYSSTPGYLVTHAHFLSGVYDSLPAWFNIMYSGQTLWQWFALVITFVLTLFVIYLLFSKVGKVVKPFHSPHRQWINLVSPLLVAFLLPFVVRFIDDDLKLTGMPVIVLKIGGEVCVIIMLAWGAIRLGKAVAETIVASPNIDPEGVQASYTRAVSGLCGFLLALTIVGSGLSRIGVSMLPVLTGLGVGGLAFGLAARPTIENLIGSFMLFLDKPCSVGQRVNILSHNGTVESIGLRSTKIRLLNGNLTAIPNEKMANTEIENIGSRPYIRRCFNVSLTYDTSPKKIKEAIDILREILSVPEDGIMSGAYGVYTTERKVHPNEAINQPDFLPQVYFNDMTADSLNIIVFYWYHPPVYWEFLEHSTWVNLQIMERFNAAGIEFAFPTQTLHMVDDDKKPLTGGAQRVTAQNFQSQQVEKLSTVLSADMEQEETESASDALRPEDREPYIERKKQQEEEEAAALAGEGHKPKADN